MTTARTKIVLVTGVAAMSGLLAGCGKDVSTVPAPKQTQVTPVSPNAESDHPNVDSEAVHKDNVSISDAKKAAAIYQQFADIAKKAEPWAGKSEPLDSEATVNLFGDLQDQINLLQQLCERSPTASIAHEVLGEAAYELAIAIKPCEAHLKQSPHYSKRSIDSEERLRGLSERAFKRAAALESTNPYPYDRLARLRVMETGKLDDPLLAVYLIQSVSRDTSSPMSIKLLVTVMTKIPLLSDSDYYLKLTLLFRQLKGEAREELKKTIPFVKNELREMMNLSERTAFYGHIDYSTQRAIRELAELDGFLHSVLGDNTIGFPPY